jgi:uncharacterized iron-regulated membrane protein
LQQLRQEPLKLILGGADMTHAWRSLHRLVAVIVISIIITGLVGCGGATKSESVRPAAAPAPKPNVAAPAGGAVADGKQPVAATRKVIETAQVSLESRDLAATEEKALNLLAKRQGKLDSSNVTLDSNGRRNGNYTLRVPAGQLREYVNELAAIPDVVVRQRNLSAQDVTEEFIDISARLENMQRHETRLREILAKANTVDEILKVEKELAAVRGQIESATGRIKALSGRIDLSTVSLRISEVTAITETNFGGKLLAIIRDSWVAAGDVVLYLVATVIVLSPLAVLVAIGVWYWKRRQKKQQIERT